MISILKATEKDAETIASIGRSSVADAHKDSCSADIMNEFIATNYNNASISEELAVKDNIYHIIYYDNAPAGFSKITFNTTHPDIILENVSKLDRIYLLKQFHGLKLGFALLQFNIALSKNNNQAGIWLYTWIGNKTAVDFYTRAGFKIIGNHDFHIAKGHYNPNYHMMLTF